MFIVVEGSCAIALDKVAGRIVAHPVAKSVTEITWFTGGCTQSVLDLDSFSDFLRTVIIGIIPACGVTALGLATTVCKEFKLTDRGTLAEQRLLAGDLSALVLNLFLDRQRKPADENGDLQQCCNRRCCNPE